MLQKVLDWQNIPKNIVRKAFSYNFRHYNTYSINVTKLCSNKFVTIHREYGPIVLFC
jgi:hypothetical protein